MPLMPLPGAPAAEKLLGGAMEGALRVHMAAASTPAILMALSPFPVNGAPGGASLAVDTFADLISGGGGGRMPNPVSGIPRRLGLSPRIPW